MKKTLSTLMLAALARLFCLLGLTFAAAATHAATLTVSPTNVVAGGTVTATWSGIATPTTTDWLALVTPGMANTTYISWRYTNGAASGSVPFTIPSVASGTYELRLFANNGFTRLATSNPFTVGTQTVNGTVTVGGSPLAGIAFAATNGGVCTSSNASGQYSCTVAFGWSGSVTPSSSGHTFTPPSRSYSNVVANQTAQDYTAVIMYVLSGTVTASGSPLAGVAFAASNGGTCTSSNASGQYSCTVPQGWSGSVTPSAGGYTFTPASRSYSNVSAGQSAQDFVAQPVAITAAIFYIHPDHLNTPRMIADQTGTAVWRWDQGEPFGNDVPNNNPGGAGAFDFPLRFPGQYFDKETGLNYNYFRDYDPSIGRYPESDPIGLLGGTSLYGYVRSKPLSLIDPFGLQAVPLPTPSIPGVGNSGTAELNKAIAKGFQGLLRDILGQKDEEQQSNIPSPPETDNPILLPEPVPYIPDRQCPPECRREQIILQFKRRSIIADGLKFGEVVPFNEAVSIHNRKCGLLYYVAPLLLGE